MQDLVCELHLRISIPTRPQVGGIEAAMLGMHVYALWTISAVCLYPLYSQLLGSAYHLQPERGGRSEPPWQIRGKAEGCPNCNGINNMADSLATFEELLDDDHFYEVRKFP